MYCSACNVHKDTFPVKDRRMTILLIKHELYSQIAYICFFCQCILSGKKRPDNDLGLYLLGIVMGILIAFIYKKFLFKGEAVPFVMELPELQTFQV